MARKRYSKSSAKKALSQKTSEETEKFRLDRWLWAARFFKTRPLSIEAINGGKVHLNGVRSKPGREVKIGDQLSIRKGPYLFEIEVLELSNRRGPAKEAVKLYQEHAESIEKRKKVVSDRRALNAWMQPVPGNRPTKKARRDFEKIQRG
ncbi:RNA-binding S4 domain-containing protein [Magnetococcales bacterium HHB-1]